MTLANRQRQRILLAGIGLSIGLVSRAPAQVSVVNMVPATNSGETARDAEPNLAVDPANPSVMAASAFTPDPGATLTGVLYFSDTGGATWNLTPAFIPASSLSGCPSCCFTTYCDITLRFAGTSDLLYLGYLAVDLAGNTNLQVGNVSSIATAARAFTALETRNGLPKQFPDQPWVEAKTVLEFAGAGNDHTYVTNNNTQLAGQTATADLSLNPVPPPPANFAADVVETAATCGQDGPSVRSAVHLDGTVYVAFYRWTGGCATSDIVVVRDDNWGTPPNAFQALNGAAGKTVATGVPIAFLSLLGNQRTGSQMAIAVDPDNSQRVYLAWGDGMSGATYTLHVRRSPDGGKTWSAADIRTINTATNPGLAINSLGKVAFLYQQLGNPGTGNRWRTHLERTTDDFSHVADLLLADVPDQKGTYPGSNPIGDYASVIAVGKDFFGVFSAFNTADMANFPNGVTYARYADFGAHQLYADAGHTMPIGDSIDPFFFHVTELAADKDFYVRDWTNSTTDHDQGQEPSTNGVFWYSSDVWNRASNSPGVQNASGWFPTDPMQAGLGAKGDNFAFVRVHRNATGSAASVTAHFLVSPFGTGSNFQDAAASPDPVLAFAAADSEQTLATGYQWHQDPTASTHACIAVQISTPDDPYIPPGLAGTAPGWPSGIAIVEDNNKAQRNLDVSHNLADMGGADYALVHNAATFPRDMVLGFESPAVGQLQGAQIEVVGGEAVPFRSGGSVVLKQMQPGENRWVALRTKVPAGDPIPVNFFERQDGRAVNGFTLVMDTIPLDAAVLANLRAHSQAFLRLALAFKVKQAKAEALGADKLLAQKSVPASQYLAFLEQHAPAIAKVLASVIAQSASGDVFGVRRTLDDLGRAVASNLSAQAAAAHAILLHQLDAFATMLQKAQGDPADIVQMVRWQEQLYRERPALNRLECSRRVVEESAEFIRSHPRGKKPSNTYPRLLEELEKCFRTTAEALEKGHEGLERAVAQLERHEHAPAALEKAHRDFLIQLQDAAR